MLVMALALRITFLDMVLFVVLVGLVWASSLVLVFLVVLGLVIVTRYGARSDHPPTPRV
jgi:hypothetical protein